MHGLPVQHPLQPSTKPARGAGHAVAGSINADRRRPARHSLSNRAMMHEMGSFL